jgi:hypothetical protein
VRPPVAIARQQIGPEYVALIDGVQDIAENDQLGAEFLSAFGVTCQAVYEVSLENLKAPAAIDGQTPAWPGHIAAPR